MVAPLTDIWGRPDQQTVAPVLTQGVVRAADRAGLHAGSSDDDLKRVAQDYGKRKARQLGQGQKITRTWVRQTVAQESHDAYHQLIAYRNELDEQDRLDSRVMQGVNLRKRFSVSQHRAEEYVEMRGREKSVFVRLRNWTALCLVICLVLGGLLVKHFILSLGEDEVGASRDATVTVYSRSDQLTTVRIGRLDRLSDDDIPEMGEVNIANDSQFDISVSNLLRSETLYVEVEGEGLVGCKVVLSGGVIATTNASAREATCKTVW